jgi:5'-methylthioadenosine phosphorylase
MKIGIIGGTGFYEGNGQEIAVETPFGTVAITHLRRRGIDVFFAPRHGKKNTPPHAVNYRGIIQALHACGATAVFATNTVGSLREDIRPGDLFVPDDFIDCTRRRATFFDEELVHVDMTDPFCPVVRALLYAEASRRGTVHSGTYVVTQGPRFETKAEIRMFRKFADVVGMTLFPEVVLARERGMCYASLCLVSNYAAGLQTAIGVDEIRAVHKRRRQDMLDVIDAAVLKLPENENRGCPCRTAASQGTM